MFFSSSSKDAKPLRLLITDSSLLISEKGKTLLEKTFSDDKEAFALITEFFRKRKHAKVECLLSGSRLVSQTRIINYSNKDAFAADEGMGKRLIDSASHAFLEEFKDRRCEIISSHILHVSLNGYYAAALKRQRVNDLKLTVFFAAIEKTYKAKLLAALSSSHVSFSSFTMSLADKVKAASKKEEFIVCSAYELSTDIAVRKAGGFFEMLTVPLGTHHVGETESSLLSFQLSLDEELKKALAALSEGISLPSSIYLLVSPDFQKAYDTAFKSDSYHSLCFSDKGFEVENMSSILTS